MRDDSKQSRLKCMYHSCSPSVKSSADNLLTYSCSDISSAMSNVRISTAPQIPQSSQAPPQQQQESHQQHMQAPVTPVNPRQLRDRPATSSTPLPAPLPQRTLPVPTVPSIIGGIWTPDQGIRFAPPPSNTGSGTGR